MTLYSGLACGTFESRSSSRSAAFFTSSGMPAASIFCAQLVGLGLLRIDFAEFFLNRAQLLAQVELALVLFHLALDVALNFVAELDDFEFLGEQHRQLAHALGGVALFEQRLAVGRFKPHRRGNEVRQHGGIADVLYLHLHLARRLRQVGEQLLKEPPRLRCIATSCSSSTVTSGSSVYAATMYGATCVNCSILNTCWPATMHRSVPSGTLSIF